MRSAALASLLVLILLLGCDPGSIEGWSKGSVPGSGPRGGGPRLLDGGTGGGGGDEDAGAGGGEPAPEPPPGDPDGPAPDPGGTPSDPSDPCMGLDYLGTCVGDTARWCEDGMLRERDCAAMGQRCRWIDNDTGYYCGDGGGTTMPPTDPDPGGGTPPPTGTCGTAIEQENLRLVNSARSSAGLGPLTCDEGLTRAARLHSQDMCDQGYFSHSSADGRSFTDRIDAQGVSYGSAGENIAWGQRDAREVHESWMSSSGHRANILGGSYNRIGIGHVDCGGSPYWTQDFTD